MDWQQGDSKDKHIQFIPAEKGWLALFEESTEEGIRIHADPVIAWCLGAQDLDDGHHIVSFGQAVIGASPWLEKADFEQSNHFFALVREEQLDADFVDELRISARHSREEILLQAKTNQVGRGQGHASWRRQRRGQKGGKGTLSPLRLFSLSQ
jgi:hypothetical protein